MSDSEGLDGDGATQHAAAAPDRSTTDRNLAERLAAVERAITDEGSVADLSTAAERDRRLEDLTKRVEEVEAHLDELDAATQALRGYVGSVRAVNEEVEQRADLALAIAERTERNATLDTAERDVDTRARATAKSSATQSEVPDEQPERTTSGAGDGEVAAAVGHATGDRPFDPDADEPAVAAAIPDGSHGGDSDGGDSDGSDDSDGGDGGDDGILTRLRDVL
ncbi:DUF7310 family coiled-coil domain-containing protein [Haloparvum sp. AD34]